MEISMFPAPPLVPVPLPVLMNTLPPLVLVPETRFPAPEAISTLPPLPRFEPLWTCTTPPLPLVPVEVPVVLVPPLRKSEPPAAAFKRTEPVSPVPEVLEAFGWKVRIEPARVNAPVLA